MTLRTFRGDDRGAAALEFALMFPFLMLLMFGSVEIVRAFEAQRRIAHVAAAMADVISQNPTTSDTELDDAIKSADVLVSPLPASDMGFRISSMTADNAGVVGTDWTYPQNSKIAGNPSVPKGYLAANESAIVADVSYDFNSPIRYVLPKTIRFVRHAYIRPRLSNQVEKQ